MKSMRPPLAAIFFMTYFHRAGGGHGPLAPPLDPLLSPLGKFGKFRRPIFSKCCYSTWHDIYRKLKCNFISSSVAIDRPGVGAVGTRAPLSPISFIFMQFLAKIWPNNWFLLHTQGWHPRLENPGSATGYLIAITLNFKVAQTN